MKLEPLLEDVLERMHVAAYVQDVQGRVIYLNPAGERLTGWHLTEVIGRRSHDIFGGSVACPCEDCTRLFHEPPVEACKSAEGSIRLRDGSLQPVRVGVSSLPDPAGADKKLVLIENLLSTACPVDTEARAQAHLHRSPSVLLHCEGFVDSLFDAIPDGISVLDPDLTIRRVNRTMAEWYRDRMPLLGRRCYEAYQKRIGPCDPCPSLRCMETGQIEQEVVEGPKGSPVERILLISFPLKDPQNGKVRQVVEFVRDITAKAGLDECRRCVSDAADRLRDLCRELETGAPAPSSPGAPPGPAPWRVRADALMTLLDQALRRWPEVGSGKR